jgi:Calx-beta domain
VKRMGSRAGTATVHFETSDGTARDGQDFIGASGVLTFEPGVGAQQFAVALIPDRRDETHETVNLTLRDASGAALGTPSTATLNVFDNDVAGRVQFSTATASTLEKAGTATITVLRTRGVADEATVRFEAIPGIVSPAADPQDFSATSGRLTFGPRVGSQTLTVNLADDTAADGAKSVRLRLFDPANGLVLGTQSELTLWLVDDE